MSLADINLYHELETALISFEQLVLDPNNPRLIVDSEDDIKYSNEKLMSQGVQSDVLDKINRSEFKVDDLVKSIAEKGFMNGTAPLIVKEISDKGEYLVLEGNRRTAAIKNILKNPNTVDDSCLDTLKDIEVKVFRYKENSKYTEEQIINVILGQIHVSGALGWGAMERAHYIYRSYLMELVKTNSNNNFVVNKTAIKSVSRIYSFKEKEILSNLKIYRVYEQLKNAGNKIRSDRFSLIDMAISDKNLSNIYFELDDTYRFSNIGMERLLNLIDTNTGPIKNPGLFRKFSFIYKNGNEEDVNKVVNLVADLDDVHSEIKRRMKGNYLFDRLNQINNDITKIDISELSNLSVGSKEYKVAAKIIFTVIKKIYPIIEDLKKTNEETNIDLPKTIEAVNKLRSKELQNIIRRTITDQPKDRKSTRLNSSHTDISRMPSSA